MLLTFVLGGIVACGDSHHTTFAPPSWPEQNAPAVRAGATPPASAGVSPACGKAGAKTGALP
ncbi:MAG: hypothetical protein K0S65_5235, partial [Labilithrix sp.]|nr:hypothetical protein [Labilithrix sp.]